MVKHTWAFALVLLCACAGYYAHPQMPIPGQRVSMTMTEVGVEREYVGTIVDTVDIGDCVTLLVDTVVTKTNHYTTREPVRMEIGVPRVQVYLGRATFVRR